MGAVRVRIGSRTQAAPRGYSPGVTPFQRTAAIFDVDDSLVDGNVGTIFTWYLLSQRLLRQDVRAKLPKALYDYARRRLTEGDMVALASKAHVGLALDTLEGHARDCFERHVRKRITAEGMKTMRRHLLAGHLVVLASGSPQVMVDEVGLFLRSHVALGTRAIIRDGVMTDELLLPLTFEAGKRDRVREACEAYGIDLTRSFLYSDSVADTPLFEAVGTPVVVNPKSAFRAEAVRRGWEVQSWRERWEPAKGAPPDEFPVEEWISWES